MVEHFKLGEIVYIIIRNPHAQNVAQVQQAAIVEHPENPSQRAIFLHDNYYPLLEDFAIFSTEEEAESAYEEAFGQVENGEYYG